MGRKKTPQTTRQQLPCEGEPTEADRAYARAVEVCNRIVAELDEQLKGWPKRRSATPTSVEDTTVPQTRSLRQPLRLTWAEKEEQSCRKRQ